MLACEPVRGLAVRCNRPKYFINLMGCGASVCLRIDYIQHPARLEIDYWGGNTPAPNIRVCSGTA